MTNSKRFSDLTTPLQDLCRHLFIAGDSRASPGCPILQRHPENKVVAGGARMGREGRLDRLDLKPEHGIRYIPAPTTNARGRVTGSADTSKVRDWPPHPVSGWLGETHWARDHPWFVRGSDIRHSPRRVRSIDRQQRATGECPGPTTRPCPAGSARQVNRALMSWHAPHRLGVGELPDRGVDKIACVQSAARLRCFRRRRVQR